MKFTRSRFSPSAEEADRATPSDHRNVFNGTRQVLMFALILVLLDAVLLAANVAHLSAGSTAESANRFSGVLWNGDLDDSYIEIFGHMQLFAAAVMLAMMAAGARSGHYATWSLIVAALLADDFLQIHETWGAVLVSRWGIPDAAGLRAQDFGELLVWGALSAVLGTLLIITHVRAPQVERRNSIVIFACVAVLAIFGVAVDQLHIVLEPRVPSLAVTAITLIETAGELIAMTLVVVVVHRITLSTATQQRDRPDASGRGEGLG